MEGKSFVSNAFNPESGFMDVFSKIVDTLILSILWLCCCIPVFTIGAASSALYYAYHKAIRQDGGHACKTFFRALKDNFKQATGIWMILLVFVLLSALTCYLLRGMLESVPMAGFFLTMGRAILCFAAVWSIYLFPYQARFENTVVNVMKNSALLTIARAPWSLLLLVIFVAAFAIALYRPAICAPVVAVYIWLINKILERIFRGIMTEEVLRSEIEADGT